jgi:Transposase
MPAKDVKAYVKRNKNDAADAEAICEAVRRPTMRFVQVKSAEQQGRLMQHRTRDLLMRQRTQVINALRAHMAELGIVAAQGREGTKALLAIIADDGDERLPVDARASLIVLAAQLQALQTLVGSIEKRIIAQPCERGEQAACDYPGDRRPGRERHHRHGHGPQRIPVGDAILQPGSGWCPDKIQPEANRSLGRFPSRATATCDAFSWSVRMPYCGAPSRARRTIPGWRSSWRGDRSRSWPLRLPTRWHASPGRCWPGEAPIGRHDSRQCEKRPTDGRMRLRPCVS